MALRSGYKGIKKLASGLKWNRPGILATDDTALANVFFPRSEQAVLGAKNFLPNNNTTQTINGIPFTKNADGSVTIGAGTASANTSYVLSDFKPKAGNYILSRGTTNGQAFLSVTKYNGSTWVAGLVEIGNQAISEKEFTVDYSGYDTLRGFIYIGSGVTISTPYTVYPMVRLASDPDDTYAPYAMTNRALTEKKANDMCTAGEHTLNLVVCAVTASSGNPEFFIPWANPDKKSITLGSDFKMYMRKNSSWVELTYTTAPTVGDVKENGFYIGTTLDDPLTADQVYGLRIQGKIIFS